MKSFDGGLALAVLPDSFDPMQMIKLQWLTKRSTQQRIALKSWLLAWVISCLAPRFFRRFPQASFTNSFRTSFNSASRAQALALAVALIITLAPTPSYAVEANPAQVATGWNVLQQARELRQRLELRQGAPSDRITAVERFLSEYGESLIPAGNNGGNARGGITEQWLPVSQVFRELLASTDLEQAFAQRFEPQAAQKAREARQLSPAERYRLQQEILQRWPVTPTAETIRQDLARSYWDQGQLGLFLQLTDVASPDAADQDRWNSQRTAAQRMLQQYIPLLRNYQPFDRLCRSGDLMSYHLVANY